jgi:hypothetical protein
MIALKNFSCNGVDKKKDEKISADELKKIGEFKGWLEQNDLARFDAPKKVAPKKPEPKKTEKKKEEKPKK